MKTLARTGWITLLCSVALVSSACTTPPPPDGAEPPGHLLSKCDEDSDCTDDNEFCNGEEVCSNDVCVSDGDPCAPAGRFCDEEHDQCHECRRNGDCTDDNEFCNGEEICSNGVCVSNGDPCAPAGRFCNEEHDECYECRDNSNCDETESCDNQGRCVLDGLASGTIDITEPDGFDCTLDMRCAVDVLLRWEKPTIIMTVLESTWKDARPDIGRLAVDEAANAVELFRDAGVNLAWSSASTTGHPDITMFWCDSDDAGCKDVFSAISSNEVEPMAVADYPHSDQSLSLRMNRPRITEMIEELESEEQIRHLLLWVIAHEIGHNLGLQHSRDRDSLMYHAVDLRRLDAPITLSGEDRAEIDLRYGDQAMDRQAPLKFSSNTDLVPSFDEAEDSDKDGLPTVFELLATRTDPKSDDTDGDGLKDGAEYVNNLDPLDPDTDGDGFDDGQEVREETDPWSPLRIRADDVIEVPANVPTCTMPPLPESERVLALSPRNLAYSGLVAGDCVVFYVETDNQPAIKGAVIRELDGEESPDCILGTSEELQEAVDPNHRSGLSAGRTLVGVRIDSDLPDEPILSPNASIQIEVPVSGDYVDQETTITVKASGVVGRGLIPQGWVLSGDTLWPQRTGALANLCREIEELTTLVNYFGGGMDEHVGLPFRIYVTLSEEAQPITPPLNGFPDHILLRSEALDVTLGIPDSDCDCVQDTDDFELNTIETLITDFTSDSGIRRIASEGVSGLLDSSALRIQWTIVGENTYYSVQLLDPMHVGPCQKILVDFEPLTDQAVRVELKTGDHTRPGDFVRREVHRLTTGSRRTVEIDVPRGFELNDVTFAMEASQQEDGTTSGAFLVHSIAICGAPS